MGVEGRGIGAAGAATASELTGGRPTVIDGALQELRSGSPSQDRLERYRRWPTAFTRFVRWRRETAWDGPMARAQKVGRRGQDGLGGRC